LLGKGIFDVFEGTERERCRESVHEALSSEAPCDAEVSLRGHACWRLRFVSLSPDPGILTIATDIADERRVDSEVRHQQRLESLGALASGIAHDFNNLLTGILGSASLASMKLPPDSPAAGQIARVLAAAEKAAELTNKMLAFSGRGQIQPGRFDLNRVVEDVLPLVRSSLGTSVSLQLALAPNLPLIDADRLHLQHALVNLLTSAAESSASEIVVRTGAMAGSDSLSPPSVFLEVKDDGVGMDEEARARILDPVFDAEASGRWRALAAVTRIIRAHDGKVRVESAPDRGTCFTVLMPALRPTGAVLEDPL
jgi:signal transduction histidine kinase